MCRYTRNINGSERVVGPWNRLPREVVMAAGLSEYKECLDNAL